MYRGALHHNLYIVRTFPQRFHNGCNNKGNMAGAPSRAESAYPSATPEFPVIVHVLVAFVLFIWQITCTCFPFLAHLAEGKINFHHHLASVDHRMSSYVQLFSSVEVSTSYLACFQCFFFVKFLSCIDNATSYQTACCGVIDNVAILYLKCIQCVAYL